MLAFFFNVRDGGGVIDRSIVTDKVKGMVLVDVELWCYHLKVGLLL